MSEEIPKVLRTLVSRSVEVLGDVIREEFGDKIFEHVESTRQTMRLFFEQTLLEQQDDMDRLYKLFKGFSAKDRFAIAHSFSLMLELMNTCENAYRSFRIRGRTPEKKSDKSPTNNIIFVLTAHPTEARAPECLELFGRMHEVLLRDLETGQENLAQLSHLLRMAIRLPMAREEKPSVEQEADHIYSILLRPKIIHVFLKSFAVGQAVYLRSWVGGDKDGHPGVDEQKFLYSLNASRAHLHRFAGSKLNLIAEDLDVLTRARSHQEEYERCKSALSACQLSLEEIRQVSTGDADRVETFRTRIKELDVALTKYWGNDSADTKHLVNLLRIFPGLVVPLELRECSSIINAGDSEEAIVRMLSTLNDLSGSHSPKMYARGLVISMTESAKDLQNAFALVTKILGSPKLPVIPLLETRYALKLGSEIVEEFLGSSQIRAVTKKYWGNRFEVMLGYSDSAKERGALSSRYLIEKAILSLESSIKKFDVTPLFFHGSGGSVERGGGSIEEQTAWWPASAVRYFKTTVQGEMVYRQFATPEILRSNLAKIGNIKSPKQPPKLSNPNQQVLDEFIKTASESYTKKIGDKNFLSLVEEATPYPYLKYLKIGSRPNKRSEGALSVDKLRAIPWVLCWTQTRLLLPVWWGLGGAWQNLNAEEKKRLQSAFENSPMFRSFVKLLGFSLAKVELTVWNFILRQSSVKNPKVIYEEFLNEFCLTVDFVQTVSNSDNLLWFRPWLRESIALRSPMIHPLNLLQMIALETDDERLLRETVTGISSGMLTTG